MDQPSQRHLYLCETILGSDANVALVYSERSKKEAEMAHRLAEAKSMSVNLYYASGSREFLSRMTEILSQNDSLLVLADSELYNEQTAKAILLTSFRVGKPLISYSDSLVRAGGLAAVVSTPKELGQQAGEVLTCLLSECDTVKEGGEWPRYYSVKLNNTIARRLGINVAAEAAILEQVKTLEKLEGDEPLEY